MQELLSHLADIITDCVSMCYDVPSAQLMAKSHTTASLIARDTATRTVDCLSARKMLHLSSVNKDTVRQFIFH